LKFRNVQNCINKSLKLNREKELLENYIINRFSEYGTLSV